jgi:uncharacterized protein (TIGR00255 family)
MIRSMTGYGAGSLEDGTLRAAVTVRSLNHRFLDVTLHLQRRLQPLEAEIRERIARGVARGRVEVAIQASSSEVTSESVVASRALVASLVRALRDMQNEFGLEGGVSVADLVRFPGALERLDDTRELPESLRQALLGLLDRALAGMDAMRRQEGERLAAELERVLECVEAAAQRIEERSAASRAERQAGLCERLAALIGELGLDDTRLYQEAVRAVERHDVAEELQRLRSHATSARELVRASGEACGKRLDFLAQELMREANTIGSKIQDAGAIHEVVGLKASIERFREQVQNVE